MKNMIDKKVEFELSQQNGSSKSTGTIIDEIWLAGSGGGYYVCRVTGYIILDDDGSLHTVKPDQLKRLIQ